MLLDSSAAHLSLGRHAEHVSRDSTAAQLRKGTRYGLFQLAQSVRTGIVASVSEIMSEELL
jgi:hypothetical protein